MSGKLQLNCFWPGDVVNVFSVRAHWKSNNHNLHGLLVHGFSRAPQVITCDVLHLSIEFRLFVQRLVGLVAFTDKDRKLNAPVHLSSTRVSFYREPPPWLGSGNEVTRDDGRRSAGISHSWTSQQQNIKRCAFFRFPGFGGSFLDGWKVVRWGDQRRQAC